MNVAQLQFTHFIVHVVDHKTHRLELSTREAPIGAPGQFPHDFFRDYVVQALSHPGHRLARFRDRKKGKVSSAFASLGQNGGQFVPVSRMIAQHLCDVMNLSRYKDWIKAGDIMVATFRDTAGKHQGDEMEYLAILKIDPSEAIIRHVRESPDGKERWVEFEESDERIPELSEAEIQKIAVVSATRLNEPQEHDLTILDNNLKMQTEVAHFFYDSFLEAELARSATVTTRVILDQTKRFVSQRADVIQPPLSPQEAGDIVAETAAELEKGVSVSVPTLVGKVVRLQASRTPEDTQKVRDGLAAQLTRKPPKALRLPPEQQVAVDGQTAKSKAKKLTYVLDRNVKIQGDLADVRAMVEVQRLASGEVKITIKSKTFTIQ